MKTENNTAKINWKNQFRATRKAATRELRQFERSIRHEVKAGLAKLKELHNQISAEVAPKLAELCEIDDFVSSGRSLVSFANNRGRFTKYQKMSRLHLAGSFDGKINTFAPVISPDSVRA